MYSFSIVKFCYVKYLLGTNTTRRINNYTPVNNLMFQKTVSYGLIFKDLTLVGSASVRLVDEGLFG